MKNKNIFLLIIVIFILLIFSIYKHIYIASYQKQVDCIFLNNLKNADAGLSIDFNNNNDYINDFYVRIITDLECATNIVELTTFKDNKMLHWCLSDLRSYVNERFKENNFNPRYRKELHELLSDIIDNPSSVEKAYRLKTYLYYITK